MTTRTQHVLVVLLFLKTTVTPCTCSIARPSSPNSSPHSALPPHAGSELRVKQNEFRDRVIGPQTVVAHVLCRPIGLPGAPKLRQPLVANTELVVPGDKTESTSNGKDRTLAQVEVIFTCVLLLATTVSNVMSDVQNDDRGLPSSSWTMTTLGCPHNETTTNSLAPTPAPAWRSIWARQSSRISLPWTLPWTTLGLLVPLPWTTSTCGTGDQNGESQCC